MGREAEAERRRRSLAIRALEACRNQLFFRHRFLEQALFRLDWAESGEISIGSEGAHLYYDSSYLLKRYMESPKQLAQDYLHTILHCLYQHPFFCPQGGREEQEACWNLASDIAVECVLEEMAEAAGQAELRSEILQKVKAEVGILSAQKIFVYLQNHIRSDSRLFGMDFEELCELFRRDEHSLWYGKRDAETVNGSRGLQGHPEAREAGTEGQPEAREAGTRGQPEAREAGTKGQLEDRGTGATGVSGMPGKGSDSREELQKIWKNTASQVLMEAQAHAHSPRGEAAASMLQTLKKLTRETYDYTEFLTKFATHLEERMQIDEDEFDYVFYTYGLRLFGKVPLIEPLEYKEKNLVREFLIAIDTSGSCQGELVEKFLTKTYNILRQTESFASKGNIHILQCDACIQEDAKIESAKELEEYIAHLTLKGFGGTDFTPVFEYADRLLESGELRRLDGLLYFTDGYGKFPTKPPKYKTAFVFLDREEDVRVPSWAMKVYLDSAVTLGAK